MNAVLSSQTPDTSPTLDAGNPWLGLASFSEETRGYFFGREEEVAELARRVRRKLLTVLFGQSGLGKTSILRAGLVPRLRDEHYCPVYVRVDYGSEAPEPALQIKQAISRSARRSGEWTQAGVAVEGESLWEFLHHRDDVLRDEAGTTLIPLLIFDQFEEIFTLAQTDDFGRARAARFIADLADLVENRPPAELEAKLELDDSTSERFDFARSDYRVLIALREDYLAPLEGLKTVMPSITQNRLRLARMTGQQALTAVVYPGRRLVTDDVAAAIVRFVAGNAEIANAEVEPSLLSLICRELNDTRIAEGRSEISLDLLAGSHASILSNFYERSLADQPPSVRRIIEDDLLTSSGYRENVAEERVVKSLIAAGAQPDALAVLVNRRLLRIEERLDVRRVELTHDVLCGVVKASRDLRVERESREATERLLIAQRERESAARHALVRARQIAVGCAILAIGAVVAAGLAYVSTQRAYRAERRADETRAAADLARGQAEQLLGYLSDDFGRELEAFGRLQLVSELAKRQVNYFKALPPALRGPDTLRNAVLATALYARATARGGKMPEARISSVEAVKLADELRQIDGTSPSSIMAIALATAARAVVLDRDENPDAFGTMTRAVAMVQPLAEVSGATITMRRAYAEMRVQLGYLQLRANQLQDSLATLESTMTMLDSLGAHNPINAEIAAHYADAGAWRVENLNSLGRRDEARHVGADAAQVARDVIELRPGYLLAYHALQVIQANLSLLELDDLHPLEGKLFAQQAEQTSLSLLKFDSANTTTLNNLMVTRGNIADADYKLGNPRESLEYGEKGLESIRKAQYAGAWFSVQSLQNHALQAIAQADIGDKTAADATLVAAAALAQSLHAGKTAGVSAMLFADSLLAQGRAGVALTGGDAASAARITSAAVDKLRPYEPADGLEDYYKNSAEFSLSDTGGQANYELRDYAASERALREALEVRSRWPVLTNSDERQQAEVSTYLAMAVVRQGRMAEAAQLIAPVIQLHRELAAKNHGDKSQSLELAAALYAGSLADPVHRRAMLQEALSIISHLPPDMMELRSIRKWHERIKG